MSGSSFLFNEFYNKKKPVQYTHLQPPDRQFCTEGRFKKKKSLKAKENLVQGCKAEREKLDSSIEDF